MPNLKVSKREQRLLGGLLIVLVLAGFYFFIYTPQKQLLVDKQTAIQEKQLQLDMMYARIKQKPTFEEKIKTSNETISDLSPKFYGALSRESFMMIVSNIVEKSELNVLSLSFDETSYPLSEYISMVSGDDAASNAMQVRVMSELGLDESFLSDVIYTKSCTVNFVGDYAQLRTLLYNIDNYDKHLDVSLIDLTSTNGQELNGQVTISASNLPVLDQDITDFYKGEYFKTPSTRKIYENFFAHYPYYVEMQEKLLAESTPQFTPSFPVPNSITDFSDEIPDYIEDMDEDDEDISIQDDTTDVAESTIIDPNVAPSDMITVISSFDKAANFIPNHQDITGSITRSADAVEGDSSIKLSYVFSDFTLTNQVSVVFEEQSVMNTVFAEKLRLSVKNLKPNRNSLKATLVGSDGKAHEVSFDAVPSDNLWHYTYASIPREVKYPFMVKRIYAESIDEKQSLDVEMLLDELGIVNIEQDSLQGGNDDEFED